MSEARAAVTCLSFTGERYTVCTPTAMLFFCAIKLAHGNKGDSSMRIGDGLAT